MPGARFIGILFVAFAAGCTGWAMQGASSAHSRQLEPLVVAPALLGHARSRPDAGASLPNAIPLMEAPPEARIALSYPVAMPSLPLQIADDSGRAETPVVVPTPAQVISPLKAPVAPRLVLPAKAVAAAAAIQSPETNRMPIPAARTLEPTLDVATLKARLRDTSAIGLFTKLALKNQVDDLMTQFQAQHRSPRPAGIASLRQPYNMLVLKVLTLLQDTDPALARSISGSREAIWAILCDPEKFSANT